MLFFLAQKLKKSDSTVRRQKVKTDLPVVSAGKKMRKHLLLFHSLLDEIN